MQEIIVTRIAGTLFDNVKYVGVVLRGFITDDGSWIGRHPVSQRPMMLPSTHFVAIDPE